jgi:hypothetical protein
MVSKMMLLAAVMLATACVPTGASDPCAGWKPIRLNDASISGLTDQDAGEILAHNEFWQKRCG